MPNLWSCIACTTFKTLQLKNWMHHIRTVHSIQPNFEVQCPVNSCPSRYRKYHSLYKHISKHHKHEYGDIGVVNLIKIPDQNIPDPAGNGENANENDNENANENANENENENENNCDDITSDYSSVYEEENDDDNVEAGISNEQMTNVELMKKNAALFILKTRERNKVTQVSLNSIIENVRCLTEQAVRSFKDDIQNRMLEMPEEGLASCLENSLRNREDPFEALQTKPLQDSYIKNSFRFVNFKEIELGTELVRVKKGQKRLLMEKPKTFMYVPIIDSLKQLLSNLEIANLIIKRPLQAKEQFYYDICDGSLYKNDNYFKDHPNALMIIIFHDELEICNPLGSRSIKHKVDMYYYNIANLNPRYRSKHCAVRLLAICNSLLVKKYGFEKIMEPIYKDLQTLHEGVLMNTGGGQKKVYGKVVSAAGDNEGQHQWGGFKEGFGVAFQKCRHCLCNFQQMQEDFVEDLFVLRNKNNYNRQCNEIENAPNNTVKSNLQTTYGINKRSSLCNIPGFDITSQLSQDVMHTLLEGTVQYEIRHVLNYFIQNKELKLWQLNGAIVSHEFGYSELADKFGPISETVFNGSEQYKLKMKAAQARLFVRLLPVLLSPLVDNTGEYFNFLVEMLKIVNLLFAPVIGNESIKSLKQLISNHLATFKRLFPNVNITPKQHYLIHMPNLITQMGPLIRHGCFSFESAHNYFKDIARQQNFKNICKSLATRNQFLDACNFVDSSEHPRSHPLFSTERQYGPSKLVDPVTTQRIQQRFRNQGLLPGIELISNVYEVNWVLRFGTKYCKGAIVIVDVTSPEAVPIFGQITKFLVIYDYVYLDIKLFDTVQFEEMFQAYEIAEGNENAFIPLTELVEYNVFHLKTVFSRSYVHTKYFLGDILKLSLEKCNPLQF